MTIDDGRAILNGGDQAATEYFKGKTTDALTSAFLPVVGQAMNEVGVTRQYKELVGRFQQIPFARMESLDLDRYVTGKGLDGLFFVLGQQEPLTGTVTRTLAGASLARHSAPRPSP